MNEITLTLKEVISIAGFFVSISAMGFAFTKWVSSGVHHRISELKAEQDGKNKIVSDTLDSIKVEYAHKLDLDRSVGTIQTMVSDVKEEQHRMSQRMDEFIKWLMQMQQGGNDGKGH